MNRIKGVDGRDKPGHDAEREETTSKIDISLPKSASRGFRAGAALFKM
jgi:hypothetical protein